MGYFDSIYAADLPHRDVTVYMYLRSRSDADGSCWPGIKRIASDLHLSRSTVKRALDDLERAGFLQRQARHRENGSHTSNLYTLRAEPRAPP